MNESHVIEHKGFVERITGKSIYVRILSQSSCGACNAKASCHIVDMQEKEVEVTVSEGDFKVGERVNLVMTEADGFSALLIAYIYPFLLVFTTLLITTFAGLTELKAGLCSIAVLPLYYLGIYVMKNKIRKKFTFSLRKIN